MTSSVLNRASYIFKKCSCSNFRENLVVLGVVVTNRRVSTNPPPPLPAADSGDSTRNGTSETGTGSEPAPYIILQKSKNLQQFIQLQRETVTPTRTTTVEVTVAETDSIPLNSPPPEMELPVAVEHLNNIFSQCEAPEWPLGVSYEDKIFEPEYFDDIDIIPSARRHNNNGG